MTDNSHPFTRDAWEANVEVWDAYMGGDGNDFFKVSNQPARVPNKRSMISIDD